MIGQSTSRNKALLRDYENPLVSFHKVRGCLISQKNRDEILPSCVGIMP